MFVRAIGNYPPYRDGWCGEVPDRIGGPLVGRVLEVVPASVVQAYARTMAAIDREIEKRITADLRNDCAENAQKVRTAMPPRAAGKRVITGAEWRRELGQKGPDVASILYAVRDMGMSPDSLDDDQRTIDLDAATAAPIRRREYDFFGDVEKEYDEVLDMAPGAVRLERLNKGAPLLDSHNYYGGTQAMIGAIVPGSAKVRAGKLTARAKFSRSEAGERALRTASCEACQSGISFTSLKSTTR